MNTQKGFFYPCFLMLFNFENIIIHSHLLFFQNLFYFLILQKNNFFYHPSYIISSINRLMHNYIMNNMTKSPLQSYFLFILSFIKQNKKDAKKVYSYLLELCSVVFFYSYYQIIILEVSSLNLEKEIYETHLTSICEKHNIKAKSAIILQNDNLLKGARIFFKDSYIDLSLKTILCKFEDKLYNT